MKKESGNQVFLVALVICKNNKGLRKVINRPQVQNSEQITIDCPQTTRFASAKFPRSGEIQNDEIATH
jgi:hypothetical protein